MDSPTVANANVPTQTQILVIGGGPGGSYTAAALAREGLSVVVLEAEKFPRYHIGESMLNAMRHFLRFIDLDEKFDNYGFTRKVGASFKFRKGEGYTDFLVGGPDNHAWNVVRAESDDLMFRHAAECGARTYDGIKVAKLTFEGDPTCSRPLAAKWVSKAGATGTIAFDYLVDASGRNGVMSAKYLKSRMFNQSFRNVACWGYWSGCRAYGEGTPRSNSPVFEALQDESGWAWMIPLHNGLTSIGVVMNQDISNKKKSSHPSGSSPSPKTHYLEQLRFAPTIMDLIGSGELKADEVKSASDYSYTASSYGGDHYRIVGDAGAFIDPYFSSGVHLALTGALSAALSICASIRGDCTEAQAAKWHTERFSLSYTRFLLVVLTAYKQIRSQADPVLADIDGHSFDRAFALFRPIIQGTVDVDKPLSQEELSRTIEFCLNAFQPPIQPAKQEAVLAKVRQTAVEGQAPFVAPPIGMEKFNAGLTEEEQKILNYINASKMIRTSDTNMISSFATDVLSGCRPRLERGSLGLERVQS